MILYAPECSMVNHKLNFKSRGKLLHANTAFFVVILGFFSGQYVMSLAWEDYFRQPRQKIIFHLMNS